MMMKRIAPGVSGPISDPVSGSARRSVSKKVTRSVLGAALSLVLAAPLAAQGAFGFAGLLSNTNRETLEPLTLASGQPVAAEQYELQSGTYYRIKIIADGSAELALSGGDFFRAVWVNELVVNDIEIRPMGVHSIEFDAAGELDMSFIAIVPGIYELSIPGSTGDTQKAVFQIR